MDYFNMNYLEVGQKGYQLAIEGLDETVCSSARLWGWDHWAIDGTQVADAFAEHSGAAEELIVTPRCIRTTLHTHKLVYRPLENNECDVCVSECRKIGTIYRCSDGCDFDVCASCYLQYQEAVLKAKQESNGQATIASEEPCLYLDLHEHPLVYRPSATNSCDVCGPECRQTGTIYRCSEGCDFDVCDRCILPYMQASNQAVIRAEEQAREKARILSEDVAESTRRPRHSTLKMLMNGSFSLGKMLRSAHNHVLDGTDDPEMETLPLSKLDKSRPTHYECGCYGFSLVARNARAVA